MTIDRRADFIAKLTPNEHVFLSLEKILKKVKTEENLEFYRPFLVHSLENVLSWEPLIQNANV